jgi:tetratricopeptide (TPR) repeat protein
MNFRNIILSGLILLILPLPALAGSKNFVESYTYNAGEADSKLTCRIVSLLEVKRLLLEKLGTYLESRTEVQDFQIAKDEIVSLTAGIVKTEILNEEWNGETYTLTARIEADPDEVTAAIDRLRRESGGTSNVRKLEEINTESLEQIREMQRHMEQLQSNLLKVNQNLSDNEGLLNSWGMYEKGERLRQTGMTEEAIAAFGVAIKNNPTALAYLQRGKAYREVKNYKMAISDFTQALEVEANMRGALFARGQAYWKSGEKKRGKKDIEKAAALGNGAAKRWIKKKKRQGKF